MTRIERNRTARSRASRATAEVSMSTQVGLRTPGAARPSRRRGRSPGRPSGAGPGAVGRRAAPGDRRLDRDQVRLSRSITSVGEHEVVARERGVERPGEAGGDEPAGAMAGDQQLGARGEPPSGRRPRGPPRRSSRRAHPRRPCGAARSTCGPSSGCRSGSPPRSAGP